jgi:exodeoxyribonuclease VII small subunit
MIMKNETFEQKLEHSKELLQKLMNPEITLEDALKVYQEGLEEITEAQKLIEDAKLKIQTINQQEQQDGQ